MEEQQVVPPRERPNPRPFSFWQWTDFGVCNKSPFFPFHSSSLETYLDFTAGFITALGVLYFAFEWSNVFISILGFLALSLESMVCEPFSLYGTVTFCF